MCPFLPHFLGGYSTKPTPSMPESMYPSLLLLLHEFSCCGNGPSNLNEDTPLLVPQLGEPATWMDAREVLTVIPTKRHTEVDFKLSSKATPSSQVGPVHRCLASSSCERRKRKMDIRAARWSDLPAEPLSHNFGPQGLLSVPPFALQLFE
jgi:hypothetical protein